jgi:threonine aldolase
LFLKVSDQEAAQLRGQGFDFYEWGPGQIRLVTSWDSNRDAVDRLAAAIGAL